MPDNKPSKRSKRPDKRPARAKYWATRKLEERKIKNLMQNQGMTRQQAFKFWHNGDTKNNGRGRRMGRVPNGFLRQSA